MGGRSVFWQAAAETSPKAPTFWEAIHQQTDGTRTDVEFVGTGPAATTPPAPAPRPPRPFSLGSIRAPSAGSPIAAYHRSCGGDCVFLDGAQLAQRARQLAAERTAYVRAGARPPVAGAAARPRRVSGARRRTALRASAPHCCTLGDPVPGASQRVLIRRSLRNNERQGRTS